MDAGKITNTTPSGFSAVPGKISSCDSGGINTRDVFQPGESVSSGDLDIAGAARKLLDPVRPKAVERSFVPSCEAGRSPSPALSGEGILFMGSNDKSVCAIDVKTGDIKWERTNVRSDYPAALSPDSKTVFVTGTHSKLQALDTETGEAIWTKDIAPFKWFTSPLVSEDGKLLFAGNKDKHLYGIDTSTGEVKWKFEGRDDFDTRPLLSGDGKNLFAVDRFNTLYALNPETGEKFWEESESAIGLTIAPFLNPAGDTLYRGSGDKTIYALDCGDRSKKWCYTWGDGTEGTYLRGLSFGMDSGGKHLAVSIEFSDSQNQKSSLVMLDADTGEEKWSLNGDKPFGAPLFSPDGKVVFLPGHDMKLRALDAETGEEKWVLEGSGRFMPSVLSHDGSTLYTTTTSITNSNRGGGYHAKMLAVDTATGKGMVLNDSGTPLVPRHDGTSGSTIYHTPKVEEKSSLVAPLREEPTISREEGSIDIGGVSLKKRKKKI